MRDSLGVTLPARISIFNVHQENTLSNLSACVRVCLCLRMHMYRRWCEGVLLGVTWNLKLIEGYVLEFMRIKLPWLAEQNYRDQLAYENFRNINH